MADKRAVLIDGTGLAYRGYYAVDKKLSTSRGQPTNAVVGFLKLFLKIYKKLKPEYMAVAFDAGRKTFRTQISGDYKANRRETPDAFKSQLPYIKRLLDCFGVKRLELPGYEADDIIATLVEKLREEGVKEIVIVTSDKDMKQLLGEGITLLLVEKGNLRRYNEEDFWEEFGIEPELLPEFFAIAGDKSDNICGIRGIGKKGALELIKEFKTLEGIYENLEKIKSPSLRKKLSEGRELAFKSRELARIRRDAPIGDFSLEELRFKGPDGECLFSLLSELEMKKSAKEIKKLFPSLAIAPTGVQKSKRLSRQEIEKLLTPKSLFEKPEALLALLEDRAFLCAGDGFCQIERDISELSLVPKGAKLYTFELKELYHAFGEGVRNFRPFDVSLASYLLNPLKKDYSLASLLGEFLGGLEIENPEEYLHHALKLGREVEEALRRDEKLYRLYREVEEPLALVLYRMEKRGVPFDEKLLLKLEGELLKEEREVAKKIYEIAGEEFNLNSPKQLARVLFEKLGLKPLKKKKSGYSTDVETLTTLALEGHEIAELLLRYRKLSKLRSTFVSGILKHLEPDGRVRSKFLQTATATGRLASSEPNLQNLPAADSFSSRVRSAVVAPEGFALVWADYSQIELRILAHLSGDENLIAIFGNEIDVHSETARRLFGADEVDEKMRRVAKTVNFGIIYGMGAHGLAERLKGISVSEAEEFIKKYFAQFPKVREFIEGVLEEARSKGYVETMFGRKRPLPELFDSSHHVRSFGERAAVNTVIQGSAADIIKMAMVKLDDALERSRAGHLILQVHDELVVEAKEEKKEEVATLLKSEMEGVANLRVPLRVKVQTAKRWS